MPARIMLIGPNSLVRPVRVELEQLGYRCMVAEGSPVAGSEEADAVVVVMRPFASAGLIASVRRSLGKVPIIVLATPQVAADLKGDDRPDDFIVPAHSPAELHTRLQRLIGTNEEAAPPAASAAGDVVRVGDLEINRATFQVFVKGRAVDLALREYQLLAFLAGNPGRVFTRPALLAHVWGSDYLGGTRTVDVHVRRIREKIAGCDREMLVTVRGVGYRFELPEESQSSNMVGTIPER
jgi:DNA-binding response OmpR family regulator